MKLEGHLKGEGIDFIIPWVDGSDKEWLERKSYISGESYSDDRPERYRDWNLLRYWFRGEETFAPWVGNIWFLCDQKPPSWLNANHPKLHIVYHQDFIPSKYLPVFSSHPIELNMHRIQGLSEYFVYFNDDTFLIAPVQEKDFFQNGLPRDCAIMNPIPTDDFIRNKHTSRIFTIYLNNIQYINRDFDLKTVLRMHPMKWFNPIYGKSCIRNIILSMWPRFLGFAEPHLPQPFLKSSFIEAWKKDEDILDQTCSHPLRDDRDINQWFIRDRQLAQGMFVPGKPNYNYLFSIEDDKQEMYTTIMKQKKKMICLNDHGDISAVFFREIHQKLVASFESILPQKSEYEN